MSWTQRHLLGIEELSPEEITHVLDTAEDHFDKKDRRAVLRGITLLAGFFEASTRTRSSFELAGKRLGADVIHISGSGSSVSKGETLLDTVKNLEAMRADVIVIRHTASGAPQFVAERIKASIVNDGDGAHEHPTQALLDAFTIRRKKGKIRDLKIAICGDILHSRVARSGALLFSKLGAHVTFCGPQTMLPRNIDAIAPGTKVAKRIEEAVDGADVVMMLRIQNERMEGSMFPGTREYSRTFGLNFARLALAKPDVIVMHPGPVNRGVEIDPNIADGKHSVILDQVEAGVAVRSAVLALVLGKSN